MAQAAIDKLADDLVAYAIVQDGFTTFDGHKRDSIVVEAGCGISGRAFNFVQQYSLAPEYEEHGNVKVAGELDYRITLSEGARNDTEELIQPLCRAPFAIFEKIAAADGRIDAKEMDAFVATLGEGLKSKNPLVVACIQMAVNNAEHYFSLMEQGALDLKRDIAESRSVLQSSFQHANGDEYLEFLRQLAEKIAQPKGGFMGFGKKVADADAQAVQEVITLLS